VISEGGVETAGLHPSRPHEAFDLGLSEIHRRVHGSLMIVNFGSGLCLEPNGSGRGCRSCNNLAIARV
jgi:hypothetical protein